MKIRPEDALEYHSSGRKGKIEISLTKPCATQRDLSLAYTPGVAVPCLEIEKNVDDVYKYTAKGNLVAVVSNGTAVLGLGDIGPEAGKPVMEGKALLFKRFADIDVFDIELRGKDTNDIIKCVEMLEPTFGGINLEDIKAPECFEIEQELRKRMNIPVFHDDQHGTAIISAAGLLNALELVGKDISKVKVVYNGAGASAMACSKLHMLFGIKKENIMMVDSKGVLYKGRTNAMNKYKEDFVVETKARTLADAMVGADVFFGLSVKDCVTKEMVKSMAPNAIIFAMANPDPEISPEDAMSVRNDIVMATGRSDYPNQVNNVLGFPFIFRGALDVRATTINEEMKMAAARALANLAKEDVPDSVLKAYGGDPIRFGKDYIIPKPLDPRVLRWVAPAVAKAAVETGVAKLPITDWEKYADQLEERLGRSKQFMNFIFHKARQKKQRIVFPEGEEVKILRAAQILIDQDLATPILIGVKERIEKVIEENHLDFEGQAEIIDPKSFRDHDKFAAEYYKIRQRKGATKFYADKTMNLRFFFSMMMVRLGYADGVIGGLTTTYPDTIRPALQVIGMKQGVKSVAGMYAVIAKKGTYFFADTTVNINPDAETLVEIAQLASTIVKRIDIIPRIAMLSFSNFGSTKHPEADKMRAAVDLFRKRNPDILIDGEMQADIAVSPELLEKEYSFSTLKQGANVLIFPDLNAANTAYKLMGRIGEAEIIGPILMGMAKPVHVLQHFAEVTDIVNMAAICAADAIDSKS
ncbi:MAG: NADP-dependent malic enzyme [Ignavibacteriales bacterium]|nr:NADP-dependent malic enzyme [Ignavibacteriales bacterium]